MKDCLVDPSPQEMGSNLPLTLQEVAGHVRPGKRRRQIQMETRVYSVVPGDGRCAGRVCHKNHAANRRYRPATNAFENAVGRFTVSTPVVSVHDQGTRTRAGPARKNSGYMLGECGL